MSTDRPPFTPLVESLPSTVPFVGPERLERQRGRAFRARLGANESGFGPAPSVQAAVARAAGEVWKYGDPDTFDLKAALGAHLDVPPATIAVGEGIDGLMGLVVRLFADPGATIVSSLGAYPTFNYHVAGYGARLVTVPYREDREDLEALLAATLAERPAIVYVANPDNPMGTWWGAGDLEHFIARVPATTLFLLDEAYGESAPAGTLPPLDPMRPNVLRLRTFSKAYGIAGLRCGYAIGHPDTIAAFDKVRNHFGVNRLAQVAALTALADQAWLTTVVGQVTAARDDIGRVARANGLIPIPSATNFVAIDAGGSGAHAQRILQGLIARDIFVRKPMAPVLERCIRVSTGPSDAIAAFAAALPAAIADAQNAAPPSP